LLGLEVHDVPDRHAPDGQRDRPGRFLLLTPLFSSLCHLEVSGLGFAKCKAAAKRTHAA
jgi:hypothetical protein